MTKWQSINKPHPYVLHIVDDVLKRTNYGQEIYKYSKEQLEHAIRTTIEALKEHDIEYIEPEGGCFVWINLNKYLTNPE
jgi:DNA-binding transcriptional MocR family regulator